MTPRTGSTKLQKAAWTTLRTPWRLFLVLSGVKPAFEQNTFGRSIAVVEVGEMVVSLKWITEIMAIQLPPNFPKPCLVWFGFKMPLFSAFSLPLTKSPCKPGYHQNSFLASVPRCTCPLDTQTRSVPTGSMHLQMQRQNCSGCWFSAHVFHTIYRAILIY